MNRSGRDLIDEAKRRIREVTPAEAMRMRASGAPVVFLDVRDLNEVVLGKIPGAVHVSRGNLETKVEAAVARDAQVVIYCASGNRSALAAHTLKELLGYENVSSMTGGITLWKDRGYDVEG